MVIQLPALKRCELKGAFLNFPENKDPKKNVGDNSHLSQKSDELQKNAKI